MYNKILFTLLCGQISHSYLLSLFNISTGIYKKLLDILQPRGYSHYSNTFIVT